MKNNNYSAELVGFSSNGVDKVITLELTYPRFIHSELMTYRRKSRNSASSRAIPSSTMRKSVADNTVYPLRWMKAHKGMQGTKFFDRGSIQEKALNGLWWMASRSALLFHWAFEKMGASKQISNRILEPYTWHKAIFTADLSSWQHFIHQRYHPDAEQHIYKLAEEVLAVITNIPGIYIKDTFRPNYMQNYHMPYASFADNHVDEGRRKQEVFVSVAQAARVSYTTVDTDRNINVDKDKLLFYRLLQQQHLSPFEHQAIMKVSSRYENMNGNLPEGWHQLRKYVELLYDEKKDIESNVDFIIDEFLWG